jgi:hypothetical protein
MGKYESWSELGTGKQDAKSSHGLFDGCIQKFVWMS